MPHPFPEPPPAPDFAKKEADRYRELMEAENPYRSKFPPWANTTPQPQNPYQSFGPLPKPPPLQHDISQIAFVTATEGGTWVPWDAWLQLPVPNTNGKRIHAILFADGHVWDAQGGPRPDSMNYSPSTIQQLYEVWDKYQSAKVYADHMRLEPEIFGVIP